MARPSPAQWRHDQKQSSSLLQGRRDLLAKGQPRALFLSNYAKINIVGPLETGGLGLRGEQWAISKIPCDLVEPRPHGEPWH